MLKASVTKATEERLLAMRTQIERDLSWHEHTGNARDAMAARDDLRIVDDELRKRQAKNGNAARAGAS